MSARNKQKKKNSRYLKKEHTHTHTHTHTHMSTKGSKNSVHGGNSGFPLWFILSDELQFMYLQTAVLQKSVNQLFPLES